MQEWLTGATDQSLGKCQVDYNPDHIRSEMVLEEKVHKSESRGCGNWRKS